MKPARSCRCPAAVLMAMTLSIPASPPTAAGGQPEFHLNAIVFESYLIPGPEDGLAHDVTELPGNAFPGIYSRPYYSLSEVEPFPLPRGLALPRRPMFLDIYTFTVTPEQIDGKRRLSRRNDIEGMNYGIRFLSWNDARRRIELSGRYGRFRFDAIHVEAAAGSSTLVRIRITESRLLYFLLTPIDPLRQAHHAPPASVEMAPPEAVTRPSPSYPSGLLESRQNGVVRIVGTLDHEGKLDRDFIILESHHPRFTREVISTLLSRWTFTPAAVDGVPVSCVIIIEGRFNVLRVLAGQFIFIGRVGVEFRAYPLRPTDSPPQPGAE
ncbi:MAG TPA: energy transducer TonB [Acidobacteriota bacterium]|nr:energy transducer TonB [Acidobacteriota bacterium]